SLLSGDRQAAEYIVQDAFARLWSRLAGLRNQDAFGAYLRATVVNLSRGRHRARSRERRAFERLGAPESSHSPSDAVDQRDRLWRELERLPHRQRAAVVLRFSEDLSEYETASILKCSERAVNALVARALSS